MMSYVGLQVTIQAREGCVITAAVMQYTVAVGTARWLIAKWRLDERRFPSSTAIAS